MNNFYLAFLINQKKRNKMYHMNYFNTKAFILIVLPTSTMRN